MTWASRPSASTPTTSWTTGCGRLTRSARTFPRLRAVAPGGQVGGLLARQRVYGDAHGQQLEPGDLEVDLPRHHVDLALERAPLHHHELRRQRLVGEAHVHDGGRMALGGGQVDQPAFAQHVEAPAVAQRELLDER